MAAFRTYYFDQALFDLGSVIDGAAENLGNVDFDTLVGTGMSGGIVVPALAVRMGKKFALVRKEEDDSHHGGGRLVGQVGPRWVFVDDFVWTGRTRSRVIQKIQKALLLPTADTMVGQYLYQAWSGDADADPLGFLPFQEHWIPGEAE